MQLQPNAIPMNAMPCIHGTFEILSLNRQQYMTTVPRLLLCVE